MRILTYNHRRRSRTDSFVVLSGCMSGTANKQCLSTSKVTFKVAREWRVRSDRFKRSAREWERFDDLKEILSRRNVRVPGANGIQNATTEGEALARVASRRKDRTLKRRMPCKHRPVQNHAELEDRRPINQSLGFHKAYQNEIKYRNLF